MTNKGLDYLKNVAPLSDSLMQQLMDVIERFDDSLTLADVIGCIELVKQQVIMNNTIEYIELVEDEDDEGGQDEED